MEFDDALRVIHHITGAFQLGHHQRGGGEPGEVDGPVRAGGQLLRPPAPVHRLKLESGVGDGRGEVGRVQLDEVRAGELIVEKDKLPRHIPGRQPDLLGIGADDVRIIGLELFDEIGAGLARDEDLAAGRGAELAQRYGVLPHLERDALDGFERFSVELDDAQRGQGAVGDGDAGIVRRGRIVDVYIGAILLV